MSKIIPKIAIDYAKYRIRICRSTLEALSNPEYVVFLINPEKKTIGIKQCGSSTTERHRMRPAHIDGKSCEIYSQPFLEKLLQLGVGFGIGHRYDLEGVYIPENDIVIFSLNKYTESEEQYAG